MKLGKYNNANELLSALYSGDITALSKVITILETDNLRFEKLKDEIINKIYPKSGNAIRIAITGAPGVGKSTFIENLGLKFCNQGKKVAVLAIDPSSSKSGGSILGDKTRMEKLANHQNSYIRPSPSRNKLGGVAISTREAIFAVEAAGYEVVLVETVGVGQSEILAKSMTDIFVLLVLPAGGDDLQGIKKGIVEMSDLIFINKADGKLEDSANITKLDYINASKVSNSKTLQVLALSAFYDYGMDKAKSTIENLFDEKKETELIEKHRKLQVLEWIKEIVLNKILLKTNTITNNYINDLHDIDMVNPLEISSQIYQQILKTNENSISE